jgi:hypothetical protein
MPDYDVMQFPGTRYDSKIKIPANPEPVNYEKKIR